MVLRYTQGPDLMNMEFGVLQGLFVCLCVCVCVCVCRLKPV